MIWGVFPIFLVQHPCIHCEPGWKVDPSHVGSRRCWVGQKHPTVCTKSRRNLIQTKRWAVWKKGKETPLKIWVGGVFFIKCQCGSQTHPSPMTSQSDKSCEKMFGPQGHELSNEERWKVDIISWDFSDTPPMPPPTLKQGHIKGSLVVNSPLRRPYFLAAGGIWGG